MNLDEISQYIPGSHNYGHYMKPIAPLLIAAAGFATSGGLEGIIGGAARRDEEGKAKREQAERKADYENFDYNQDVGPINDPYRENILKTERYNKQQIDQASANQLDVQQRSGRFGAAQSVLSGQTNAALRSGQQISNLRQKGAQYVETQRQNRIQDKFNQSQEFLSIANKRLSVATKARQMAREKLIKGIGAGVTAGGAGLAAGGGLGALKDGSFDSSAAWKGSGLLPSHLFQENKEKDQLEFNSLDSAKIGGPYT